MVSWMAWTAPMARRDSSLSRERAVGSEVSDDEISRKSRASSRMPRSARAPVLATLAQDLGLEKDEIGEREEADEAGVRQGQLAGVPGRRRRWRGVNGGAVEQRLHRHGDADEREGDRAAMEGDEEADQ